MNIFNKPARVQCQFSFHAADVAHTVVVSPPRFGMSTYDVFKLTSEEVAWISSENREPASHRN